MSDGRLFVARTRQLIDVFFRLFTSLLVVNFVVTCAIAASLDGTDSIVSIPGITQLGKPGQAVTVNRPLSSAAGTISFWVKPAWGAKPQKAQPLLSIPWNDRRHSYLAVSQTWWEPAGAGRLYFVLSNEDFVECSGILDLPQGIWSRIAATWKGGPAGFCKIFVDDSLIGSTAGRLNENLLSLDKLYLGSDEGTTERFGRTANAQIRNLQISSIPVTHRQVIQTYLAEEDARQRDMKHWGWLRTAQTSNAATPVDFSTLPGVRALFDEDIAWAASPESVEKRLLSVKNAGFNTYIPCIWHGRGSVYPSQLVFSDDRLAHAHSAGWDPLEYLVRRAHQMNLSVHVWVTVARRETDAFPQWHGPGVPNEAYDVHDEAFRSFVVDMMIDVVRRYDVDGVNLDYIRAMGICVSPSCAQDYFRTNKHALLSDRAAASQGGDARFRIQKWQDEAVGDIVFRFSTSAHQIRSRLQVSADTHLSRPEFRELEGRNDFEWVRQGWLDMVFHMDYRAAIDVAQIDWARTQVGGARKLALLFANYDVIDEYAVPRDGAWVASVVEYAQKRWPGIGIGVYLYNYMNADQQNALGDLIGGRSFGIANRQRVK